MFAPGRFYIRSWMVIYVGLIAAIVLAGRPVGTTSADIDITAAPAITVTSPLLRRDL